VPEAGGVDGEPGVLNRALMAIGRDVPDDRAMAEKICQACVHNLDVDGASILVLTTSEAQQMLWASDPTARLLEELQFSLGEGACMDASTTGTPVFVPDLHHSTRTARWPIFAAAVAERTNVTALFALPLQWGAARLGVLVLYRVAPGELSEPQRRDALAAANTAALMLLTLDTEPGRAATRWLDHAILTHTHTQIHQATGMVLAQLGIGAPEAVASPMAEPENPDEVIVPAREGTRRVLWAARDGGARRVVLTSSFAAGGYSAKPDADYTEADWTYPELPGLAPYPRSKTIAERTAWDFIEREGGDTELVVVNPTFILGPAWTTHARSSLQLIKAMLDGMMPVLRRQRSGVVDVRDVADLHIRAMAAPAAAGKRYLALADGPAISFLEVAQILRERLGPLAERVPTEEEPGSGPTRLIIHNDRAREELGWRPTPGRDHDHRDGREPARPRPAGELVKLGGRFVG
jgi:nucleoside-diphosphate-sugar epimerase